MQSPPPWLSSLQRLTIIIIVTAVYLFVVYFAAANHRQDQAALTVLIHWKYPKYINHAEGSNFKLSAGCWVRHQDEKRWPKCMIDKLKVPKWAPTLGSDNAEAEEEEAAPVPKHTKKKKKKHHK